VTEVARLAVGEHALAVDAGVVGNALVGTARQHRCACRRQDCVDSLQIRQSMPLVFRAVRSPAADLKIARPDFKLRRDGQHECCAWMRKDWQQARWSDPSAQSEARRDGAGQCGVHDVLSQMQALQLLLHIVDTQRLMLCLSLNWDSWTGSARSHRPRRGTPRLVRLLPRAEPAHTMRGGTSLLATTRLGHCCA